jgi:methylthioribose-1-phosphate isomerase
VEERNPREISHLGDKELGPPGVRAANPAFDITPSKYVTAIITEKGIIRSPFKTGIKRVF